MANIIRPIAGSVASYTSCGFTATDFNSLANLSQAVMPTANAIDNATNLDDYMDVSFVLTVGGSTTVASFLALYLMPLNQDGTTYGDTIGTGSVVTGASYWMTNCFVRATTTGNTLTGTFPTIWIPRKRFILGIQNNLGVALAAAAAAAVQYNTTNLNGNG